MTTLLHKKQYERRFLLIALVALVIFSSGILKVHADSDYCVQGAVQVPISDDLVLQFGGSFGDACRSLGGQVRSILPQYQSPGFSNAPVQNVNTLLEALVWLIKFFQIVFWILTVAFGLYAAYLYLFAAGNKESAAQARRVLGYTVIAAIISIVAYAIPGVVDSFLNG